MGLDITNVALYHSAIGCKPQELGLGRSEGSLELYRIYEKNYSKYLEYVSQYSTDYKKSITYALKKLFVYLKKEDEPKAILEIIKKKGLDQYCMKGLRNWLNFCEKEDLMDDFNLHRYRKKFKIPQQHKPDIFVPSKDEISKSLDNVRNYSYKDYLIMRILLESGCRITELEYFLGSL